MLYKKKTATIFFLALAGIFGSHSLEGRAQNNSQPLTNTDIIQMTKEEVDESIILRAISTSEINFDISANGLIQLKRGKVKKHIIEAIQNAQLKKNNARHSPNTSSSSNTTASANSPHPVLRPAPTPSPMPTPEPTPVQIQEANFFTFELEKCTLSGTTVACFFTIINNGQDRYLDIRSSLSYLIDDSNAQAKGEYGKIGAVEKAWPRSPIVANSSVKAWIRFQNVSPSAQKIARLNLAAGEARNAFNILFSDVPLSRTTKSAINTSAINSGRIRDVIPETEDERKRRERRERENREKLKREVNDIINIFRRRP